MRQRMVKPEFFSSESLAECDFATRLCFIGLWCCADDKGNLKFAPRSLRKEIFGMDDVGFEEFNRMLYDLQEVRCIRFYAIDENVYINIPNFGIYQTINRPTKSSNPEYSRSAHCILTEDSLSAHPKEINKEIINKMKSSGSADAPLDSSDWKKDYAQFIGGGSDD